MFQNKQGITLGKRRHSKTIVQWANHWLKELISILMSMATWCLQKNTILKKDIVVDLDAVIVHIILNQYPNPEELNCWNNKSFLCPHKNASPSIPNSVSPDFCGDTKIAADVFVSSQKRVLTNPHSLPNRFLCPHKNEGLLCNRNCNLQLQNYFCGSKKNLRKIKSRITQRKKR